MSTDPSRAFKEECVDVFVRQSGPGPPRESARVSAARSQALALCGWTRAVGEWLRVALAQRSTRMPRIGYLCLGPREAYAARVDAFLEGLRDLGLVDGETVTIEWRFAPADNNTAL